MCHVALYYSISFFFKSEITDASFSQIGGYLSMHLINHEARYHLIQGDSRSRVDGYLILNLINH